MRITMPTIYSHIKRDLQRLAGEMQQVNETIASGRQYQNIYQNPAETTDILRYSTDLRQLSEYQRNLKVAENWLQGTESTLQQVSDLVSVVKAMANQMATGVYNAADRAAAAQAVQEWLEEIMQAGNININGQYLLSGYQTDTPPFVTGDLEIASPIARLQPDSSYTGVVSASGTYTGTTSMTYVVEITQGGAVGQATFRVSEDGGQSWTTDPSFVTRTAPTPIWSTRGYQGVAIAFSDSGNLSAGDRFLIPIRETVVYQGDEHSIEIGMGRNSRLTVNLVGNDALGGSGGEHDLFQILARLKSYLEANDITGIGETLAELDGAQSNIVAQQAELGARQERVRIKQEIFLNLHDELTSQLSETEDTDVVSAMTTLRTKEVAYQAALLSSTRVMELSLLNYL